MAWIIGESFDFYTAIADASSVWDSVDTNWSLVTGRFSGSRCLRGGSQTVVNLVKSSGSNDATHHIVCAFEQTDVISGTVLGRYFQLLDGTVGQVCIVFRTDGAILLTSGTPGGTVLATYSGAFAQNVWTAFEFEVTINNTTGAFHVRKDGATSDSFAATGLNTRPGVNAYANKLQVGGATGGTYTHFTDDLLWFSTSGAAPNTWVGDVRAVQLMPNGDTAQKQFTKGGSAAQTVTSLSSSSVANNQNAAANTVTLTSFVAATTGVVNSFNVGVRFTVAGHFIAVLYDASGAGGGPGALIGQSVATTNQVAGQNTIIAASGTPANVVAGTTYWVGLICDAVVNTWGPGNLTGATLAQTYGSGPPSSMSGFTLTVNTNLGNWGVVITAANAMFVSEVQEDGDVSYVSDNVVGHNDLYDITDLASAPLSVVAVQTRGFVKKSDAGARSAELQLKSGATTVTSAAFLLSTSYQYTSRIDTVDPNTSAAWTGAAINAIQIGPVVQA